MKLIIQIPCFNEEGSLPTTLADLPRTLPGITRVEWLVIDDGSTDGTSEVARKLGVDHIIRHARNWGLAKAFATGLDSCVRLGADIIVNTDADNQYVAADIADLIRPIVDHRADMVVGDRNVGSVAHFSAAKKVFQKAGSWVVSKASGYDIPDTTSGFRALSRAAAVRLNVLSDFTYTLETIIQASHKNLVVTHVPVRTNAVLRPSRLFRSTRQYVRRSTGTILRIYAMYSPLKVFSYLGAVTFGAGMLLGVRFLVYRWVLNSGNGKIQSLLLGVLLMLMGFQMGLAGLLADLIGRNRQISEETLWRVRKLELERSKLSTYPAPVAIAEDEGMPLAPTSLSSLQSYSPAEEAQRVRRGSSPIPPGRE